MATLAASVASQSGSSAIVARNRIDRAEARILAESAVNLAILRLADANPNTRWPADGYVKELHFPEGTVTVRLQDEGGKIDLNTAPIELIDGLTRELSLTPAERSALIRGIEVRRRAAGQNSNDASPPTLVPAYADAAEELSNLIHQAFADISELRLLPGMTTSAYERLEPYVTVDSRVPTVDPRTAPRAVLLAVPGISPQEVGFYLTARGRHTPSNEKPDLSDVEDYVRVAAPHAFSIVARATTQNGAHFSRNAVIEISPNLPLQPFRIIRWR